MKGLKEISERIQENINQFLEAVDGAEWRTPIEQTCGTMLDKAIFDMKRRLDEAKGLVATAIAEEQRLKRAYQEAVDAASVWSEEADKALQNRDTARTSEAQQRKRHHLNLADSYKRQIATQTTVVTSLKTALHEFYRQFQSAARHAETLSHRQKQAETRAELYKLIASAEKTISTVLAASEQKLKTAEEKAEIWENRNRRDAATVKKNADGSNLDQTLEELKNEVLGSNRK